MDHNKQDIESQISKWLNGELTEAEAKALQERPDFEDFQQILAESERLAAPEFDAAQSLKQLKGRLPKKEAKRRYTGGWAIGIAATLALLLTAWWLIPVSMTQHETLAGQQEHIVLPDGSEVWLNAASTLDYYPDHWDAARTVLLSGEAFFQVRKGGAFTVKTIEGKVEVLGTSFNVYAREKQLETQCYTGKVRLSTNINVKAPKILTAGQGWRWTSNQWEALEVAKESTAPGWTKGETAFKNSSLKRVFQDMERQYDIKINNQENDQALFSGYFVHDDLNMALKMVCEPMGLNFEIKDSQTVRIYK